MISPIRRRGEFEHLQRHGQRVRTSSLWCTALVDPSAMTPRVAFAIGRPVGSAVVRNRLRRRIRELLRVSDLSPGWYLVGARPSAIRLDTTGLRAEIAELVSRVGSSSIAPPPPPSSRRRACRV